MLKRNPGRSAEPERLAIINQHEQELRTLPDAEYLALIRQIATRLKNAGLFSRTTYLEDIITGLRRRVTKWGWRK